jgi:hypothetical protein
MGFVVVKVVLGQVFFPSILISSANSHPIDCPHIHHHILSGACKIGKLVADVPSGLRFTPIQETKNKK